MTETSLRDALQAVEKGTSFAEPLRRRTEGMTIAWWGLVTAGIILTSGILDDLHGFMKAGGWKQVISATAWVPWAILGILGTLGIWRVAETGARRRAAGRRRSIKVLAAWSAVLVVILLLMVFVVPVAQAGIAIAVVGLIWFAIGALDLYQATPVGRRTILTIGSIIIVAGVVFGASTATDNEYAWSIYTVVGVLVDGLVPIAAGLWQTLRR